MFPLIFLGFRLNARNLEGEKNPQLLIVIFPIFFRHVYITVETNRKKKWKFSTSFCFDKHGPKLAGCLSPCSLLRLRVGASTVANEGGYHSGGTHYYGGAY